MSEKQPYYDLIINKVKIECLDVIEKLELGFNLGNVMKYIWRAGRKTPDALEDLKKAKVYLEREIKNRESTD